MRAFAFVMLCAAPAAAADLVLNHAGRLLDENEVAVSSPGGLTMKFAIYVSAVPLDPEETVWEEEYLVPVHAGMYSVTLGSLAGNKKALPSGVFPTAEDRYLEVTVAGQVMLPRMRIGTVPAAGLAHDLDCAGCIELDELGFVIDTTLDAGEVTTEKIALGAVTDDRIASVAAGKITGQLVDAQIASVAAAKIGGLVTDGQIEGLAAVKITGQLADAQIEGMDADKLAGLVVDDQIEGLSASKLDGQLTSDQIASLDAAKLTGAINPARLPAIPYGSLTGTFVPVPTAASAPTSPVAGALYWDSALGALRVYNGQAWVMVGGRCGDTAGTAARSCKVIKDTCAATQSKTYWINGGGATAFEAYCNMTDHGGGWTLVLRAGVGVDLSATNREAEFTPFPGAATNPGGTINKMSDTLINALRTNSGDKIGYWVTTPGVGTGLLGAEIFHRSDCTFKMNQTKTQVQATTCHQWTTTYSDTPSWNNGSRWHDNDTGYLWAFGYQSCGTGSCVCSTDGRNLGVHPCSLCAFHRGWCGNSDWGLVFVK